jgi:uncharacterized protein
VADRLPLFPLGTVLFPGLVLPLHIFEDRYRRMVRDLVTHSAGDPGPFGVVAIRRGWEAETPQIERVEPAATEVRRQSVSLTLYDVGCTAEIRQITEHPGGQFDLVTVGRRRFRITGVDADSRPYLIAEVEWLAESAGDAGLADRLAPAVLAVFRRYLRLIRPDPEQPDEQLPDNPTVLSHLVAATAALTLDDRQTLLAIADTATRLRAERVLLSREVRLLSQVRAVPVPLRELGTPTSPN